MPAPTPESSAATVKPGRGINLSCLDMFIEEREKSILSPNQSPDLLL
jgi:hypothetical protein